MAQSKEDLEHMGWKLQKEYSTWGFTINIAKTKYMSVGTDTNHIYTHTHTHTYAAAHLLRSWVRIPPGTWIFVCCECRVLSGRGLCDELITRPEES